MTDKPTIINIDEDGLTAEDMAMLQALYSRSSESVLKHLDDNKHTKSGEFMKRYYVNYGHASIAECGTTTFFIENVSILAAKEIQNNPLYRGQETSSRYIDFRSSGFYTPNGNLTLEHIQHRLLDVYEHVYNAVVSEKMQDAKDKKTQNAVKAYAFDVARGFLPAGMKTQLSWTTDLRNLRENLSHLLASDLPEVRVIASEILEQAQELFPSTFDGVKPKKKLKHEVDGHFSSTNPDDFHVENNFDNSEIRRWINMYENDGEYTINDLDQFDNVEMMGYVKFFYSIDYGSWRDIQRHRRGFIEFVYPDVSKIVDIGQMLDSSFYIRALPEDIKKEVYTEMLSIYGSLQAIGDILGNEEIMYATPMMTNVPLNIVWDMKELVYVLKLRSQPTVHPSLRATIRTFQQWFANEYGGRWIGDDSPILIDPVTKRGEQTIEEKVYER